MPISSKYVKVEKVQEEKKEGFQAVQTQDSFVYKGRIIQLPDQPAFVDNHPLELGDIVIFAKYSPDTFEINDKKYVLINDILEVL